MKVWRMAAACGLTLLLCACAATGPRFSEVEASFPPLRADAGRIFFYRIVGGVGQAVRMQVQVDGQPQGVLAPGAFFFVERPAGHHTALARGETEAVADIDLNPGETAYVRLDLGVGLFAPHPQLTVRPGSEAGPALASLAYVGSIPLVPSASGARGATTARATARPAAPVTLDDLSGLMPATR